MDSIAPYSSAVAIRILVEFRSALSARFADPAILEALSPLIFGDFGVLLPSYSALRNHQKSKEAAPPVWPGPGTARTLEEKAERNSAGHCAGYSGEVWPWASGRAAKKIFLFIFLTIDSSRDLQCA